MSRSLGDDPGGPANFCFGDDDLRSLYVTASTSVYRLRIKTPGTAQWPSS
jgi:gluconolactonase